MIETSLWSNAIVKGDVDRLSSRDALRKVAWTRPAELSVRLIDSLATSGRTRER